MNDLDKALQQAWSSNQEANFHILSSHSPELERTAEDHLKEARRHLLQSYEATKTASELLARKQS